MFFKLPLVTAFLLVTGTHGIFDGNNATIKDFPYLVSFERNGWEICLGSIIHSSWVLTTARCVDGYVNPIFRDGKYAIRAGSNKRNQNGTVHMIHNVTVHWNYSLKRVPKLNETIYIPVNDVALIKVKEPFVISDTTKVADLVSEPAEGNVRMVGFSKYVEGSHEPEYLQWIELPVMDSGVCNESFNGGANLTGTLCAGTEEFEDDHPRPCYADEGGPVVDDAGSLAGLVSLVHHCSRKPYYPVLFTDVANYKSWIDRYVEV